MAGKKVAKKATDKENFSVNRIQNKQPSRFQIGKKDVLEIVLAFFLAWIFYQGLGFATGTSMPIVSVVSDSMYHDSGIDAWWAENKGIYEGYNIDENDFRDFAMHNGLSRGDLLFVVAPNDLKVGDVVLYQSDSGITIVHRIVDINDDTYLIKGDNNFQADNPVLKERVKGKAIVAVPLLGYPRFALNIFGI